MDFGSVYFGHLGLVCINSAVDLFWIGLLYREKRAMHAGRPAGFTVVVVKQLSAAMEYADGPASRSAAATHVVIKQFQLPRGREKREG